MTSNFGVEQLKIVIRYKIPDNKVVKLFVSGLNTDMFRVEISPRMCENTRNVVNEAREEYFTFREFLEINERMKKTDVRKEPGKGAEMPKPK
jgi:hypothetical protein